MECINCVDDALTQSMHSKRITIANPDSHSKCSLCGGWGLPRRSNRLIRNSCYHYPSDIAYVGSLTMQTVEQHIILIFTLFSGTYSYFIRIFSI